MARAVIEWPDDPAGIKIGSLFAGYGGLELGVSLALGGGRAIWHSEIEEDPAAILAYHWPDVPNLGDVTKVDWSTVEPVHVITGGSPCQDLSTAGRRAGMKAGTRSGLWASMADAIEALRPPLVVWENVRGALSAEANCDVELCAGCVGNQSDVYLRALGRLLGDLADLGYDAQWQGLRAADVGAPHGRFRVFVVATDAADSRSERLVRWLRAARAGSPGDARVGDQGPVADGEGERHERAEQARNGGARPADRDRRGTATDADRGELREQPESGAERSGAPVARVPHARSSTDAHGLGDEPLGVAGVAEGAGTRELLRRSSPPAGADREPGRAEVADAEGDARRLEHGDGGTPAPEAEYLTAEAAGIDFGRYALAIRRWELITGRPAPCPVARSGPSAKYPDGKWVLSAEFSEWMMGLPYHHVTDPAIWEGVSETAARQAALKACGNGVVPLQAAAAVLICLRYFLDDHPAARVNDETRRCPCGNELIRRRDEGHARYAARKFCSRECAKTYRSKA